MNFNEILKIDETDKKIIMLLQENPDLTHSEIAEKVGKSQPAVGARIIKLKRKNLIATQVGMNFKKVGLKLALVTMTLQNPQAVIPKLAECPFIIHAFKTSGPTNLCVMIGAADIADIDRLVDECIRGDANVSNISVNFVLSSAKDLVLPLNFDIENAIDMGCGPKCFLTKGVPQEIKEAVNKRKQSILLEDLEEKGDGDAEFDKKGDEDQLDDSDD
ncbi:MAG TPA: Lrp/AsnC family transcriptional regulator [Candidatus Lokiarchaeia archaeon]|nr:Lrp/AsnC family transcriptional regulator [Candidatus Lokiarchaeia archaeon]